MDDLISRQAAIDAVIDEFKRSPTPAIRAKFRLEALPSVQPERNWIPCSERLPSKADHIDNMVLVCYGNGSVRFNTYMNGWVQGNPVAWMPLPDPYKEEQE